MRRQFTNGNSTYYVISILIRAIGKEMLKAIFHEYRQWEVQGIRGNILQYGSGLWRTGATLNKIPGKRH
jgi:hypothetical protein